MNALEVLDLIMSSDKEFKSKAALLNEVLDKKDKWRVSIDDHAKAFVVYRDNDDICGGYFNPETKTLNNIEFMQDKYRKNNMIRQKAMITLKKSFPGYTTYGGCTFDKDGDEELSSHLER